MSQQEMTSAIHDGVRRALADVLQDDEEKNSPVPPMDALAALAIREGMRGIEDQLRLIGFMGLVIAVSLIGIFAKLMGWLH